MGIESPAEKLRTAAEAVKKGARGPLDALLEVMNEREVADAILGAGTSERRIFAAMAMQGYCSVHKGWDQPTHEVARCSVAIADALLAELEKQP